MYTVFLEVTNSSRFKHKNGELARCMVIWEKGDSKSEADRGMSVP